MSIPRYDLIEKDCADILADNHRKLFDLKDQTVLITGGTGFVGTWLTSMIAFLNDNYDFRTRVILLSLSTDHFRNKVPHLADRNDISILEQDVRNIVDISDDVVWIIHAASSPDSRIHASNPLRTIDVIVNGTSALLAASVRLSNLRMILNISSGLVYGHQYKDIDYVPENSWGSLDPVSIAAVYAEAKRCSETICTAYRNEHRIPVVTARPFAFIGPYQMLDKPWAVNNFLRDKLLGGPIRILGNPETVRSYLYASDMAFWFLRILTGGISGQCFNVGSPHSLTLSSLAYQIANRPPAKVEVRSPQVEPKNWSVLTFVPDTSLARACLGLEVTVKMDEALDKTLAWYQRDRG